MLRVTILGYKREQRYIVRRAVVAAGDALQRLRPDVEISISELKDTEAMGHYTHVFFLPSLMLNEQLVCVGRFPKKDEVLAWMQAAL